MSGLACCKRFYRRETILHIPIENQCLRARLRLVYLWLVWKAQIKEFDQGYGIRNATVRYGILLTVRISVGGTEFDTGTYVTEFG